MKSLYGRQFLLTAGMILISFALLGTAFIGLSYQYTIRETRDSMERNADYVADFTAKVRAEGIDVRDMAYQLYVANVAHIANAFVLVTESWYSVPMERQSRAGWGGTICPSPSSASSKRRAATAV